MLKTGMRICAVIPAFNDETTISEVVEKTRREIDHILVVDDGSADETARFAQNAGADVISVSKNRGKGNALRIGFRYALANNFDAIITLDSDLQHDPSEIPKFIKYHETSGSKIVIGARLNRREKMPRARYANNVVGKYTFSWLTGQFIEDSQCGFRLYDREVMQNIHILNDGFEAEADILLRAGKKGYKIGFVPIETIYFSNHQHQSHYRPVKDTFRISIIFLMNLFWKDR
jgi:glycosyltransferase involved in cell wall biosynthesis